MFETLPVLYRAVLDAVADLESVGYRREAASIRSEATAAYSRAWTRSAARRMHILRTRSARLADSRRRSRHVPLGGLDRARARGSTA